MRAVLQKQKAILQFLGRTQAAIQFLRAVLQRLSGTSLLTKPRVTLFTFLRIYHRKFSLEHMNNYISSMGLNV